VTEPWGAPVGGPFGEPGQAGVEVRSRAGDAYAVAVRGHELHVDQPTEEGGSDTAPTPVELFVGSLAASVALHAGRFLARQGIAEDAMVVRASFRLSEEPPSRVERVCVRVVVPRELPPGRLVGLREALERCTVTNTVRGSVAVDLEIDDYPSLAPG
jgi:uncharacterized OsmC-like protein